MNRGAKMRQPESLAGMTGGGPILLTGGTAEARRLAEALAAAGWPVTYALAGVTPAPRLPEHAGVRVRRGGFGGVAGLAAWLREHGARAVVDATHAHARAMPAHVAEAAALAGVPALRFLPPPPPLPAGLAGACAGSPEELAARLPGQARAVAALGSRGLAALRPRGDTWLHARMLTPPAFAVPSRWRLIIGARGGPRATVAQELAWLRAVRADWVLARHAAGSARLLRAAARLGIRALVLAPPPPPAGVPVAHTREDVLRWLRRCAG